jgi:glycosyltransferase involved in cell wall biosynthesis
MALQKMKVSVLMSVYNDEFHVGKAVESILDQTFSDFEFIIINDGSTDRTKEIIESFRDSRITLISRENKGLTESLNEGIRLSRGQYIARQDADDVSLPERLAKQIEFLDSHQDVVLVGTSITLIDEDGRRLRDYTYPSEHSTLCRWLYAVVNPLPHSTIMFRRDAVLSLGGYDERFYKAQDYALHLCLVKHYQIASIPEPLILIRYRTNSIGFADNQAEQLRYALLARALVATRAHSPIDLLDSPAWPLFLHQFEKWFESSPLRSKFAAAKLRRAAEINWRQHNYLQSLRLLLHSVLRDPQWPLKHWHRRHAGLWDQNIEERMLEMMRVCMKT